MATFKGSNGREYRIPPLTVSHIRKVQAATGINLVRDLEGGQLLHRLANDPVSLLDVLAQLAIGDKPSPTDAAELEANLTGDSTELAANALADAVVDFLPKVKGDAVRQAWAIYQRAVATIPERMATAAKDAMASFASGDSSTKSPESSV